VVRQLQTVVGLGLRFQTPVASLAFDYGVRAVHTGPFGLAGAFQFAFQTF
jgi:outer membrane protein assembly factor BamA